MLTAETPTATRREAAFWRIIHHLGDEIAALEHDLIVYREMAQTALAQNAVLAQENSRLRRSREAEAAITGEWQR